MNRIKQLSKRIEDAIIPVVIGWDRDVLCCLVSMDDIQSCSIICLPNWRDLRTFPPPWNIVMNFRFDRDESSNTVDHGRPTESSLFFFSPRLCYRGWKYTMAGTESMNVAAFASVRVDERCIMVMGMDGNGCFTVFTEEKSKINSFSL